MISVIMFMAKILEPIVTTSQALKVTSDYVTISSMKNEMAEFSKRLNLVADQNGMPAKGSGRQGAMAALFGVSQKGARKWLEGEAIPKLSRLNEIAKHFGVNSEWLLSGRGSMPQEKTEYGVKEPAANYINKKPYRLPLIPFMDIGEWRDLVEQFRLNGSGEWIETTTEASESAFALKVRDGSMFNADFTASLPGGTVIIIETKMTPTNGKIVVAKLPGNNDAMLKKLIIDGPNKYLKSLSPDYKPISIDDNCEIIGVAKRIEIDL